MDQIIDRFNSLEDYLISAPLTVDGVLNDGGNVLFPVKGREINATILFADISGFSAITANLTPTETLAFVNNFFTWISAEALSGTKGIVDKYIGDEIMVVFAEEFGSKEPFLEAVQAARYMSEHDVHSFCPHIGIASGPVTVGYVGTRLKYNCSVFGQAVALAARCASHRPTPSEDSWISSYFSFPAEEWDGRDFTTTFPNEHYRDVDGNEREREHGWKALPPQSVELKNMGEHQLISVVNHLMHIPSMSASERARVGIAELKQQGRYRPN